jgi:hypothetical protein
MEAQKALSQKTQEDTEGAANPTPAGDAPQPDAVSSKRATGTSQQGEPELVQRIRDLESALSEKDKELEGLRPHSLKVPELEKGLSEAQDRLEKVQAELGEAVGRYQSLVIAANPDIPSELISGATIAEIEASLQKARGLVEKIRESILKTGRADVARKTPIPAGAPARTSPDVSDLSPREKIKFGITQRK